MPQNNVAADSPRDIDVNTVEKDILVDTTNIRYEATPIDTEIEKRVLRKIDLFLMPAMVIGQSGR